MSKVQVAILGGGVCGLYAALKLARVGMQVTVLEKGEVAGGLAAGVKRGENFYDLGVHMLHAFDEGVFEDAVEYMGEERIEVELDAKIRWAGAFYRYPLQFGDMVRGMRPLFLGHCVIGLFLAQIKQKLIPMVPQNAEEALRQLYGDPLYRFFFEDFTHRYWSLHPRDLSATFIMKKMPRLTAVDVFRKGLAALGLKQQKGNSVDSALSEETLHYARTGSEALPRLLAKAVEEAGGNVILNADVSGLDHDGKGRATGVRYRVGGKGREKKIAAMEVINTIPMPALVRAVDPAPPREVIESAAALRFLPITIFGLLVNKPKAIDSLYIYYRERCFHRVGEPKNAGLQVNPADHTVLIVETTSQEGDEKWTGAPEFIDRMMDDLEAEGICTREDVVETHVINGAHGYPVFELGFEPHLDRLQGFIDGIVNLQSVGRQGGFCYPNMHAAMRMGADAAEEAMGRLASEGGVAVLPKEVATLRTA